MATLEIRKFGAKKHLLVMIANEDEEEAISQILGDAGTQISGSVKRADGWREMYLQLEKGVRNVNEKLADTLSECADWHYKESRRLPESVAPKSQGAKDHAKRHKKWEDALRKASEKV